MIIIIIIVRCICNVIVDNDDNDIGKTGIPTYKLTWRVSLNPLSMN